MINSSHQEVDRKLEFVRKTLTETGSIALRLRGNDWFVWATAGGSNTVLLAAETGVAEVLITAENAFVLTDEIEAQRLQDEELPANFNCTSILGQMFPNAKNLLKKLQPAVT